MMREASALVDSLHQLNLELIKKKRVPCSPQVFYQKKTSAGIRFRDVPPGYKKGIISEAANAPTLK
jgi:hypothetical protein